MKKICLFLISLFLLISCGVNNNNNKDDSDNKKDDPIIINNEKTFQEMFIELQSLNISFETLNISAYITSDNLDNEYSNYATIYTRFQEGYYDLNATIIESNTNVSYRYFKDSNGLTSKEYINLNNEVIVEPLLNSNNESFNWDNSIYFNLFSLLSYDDFILVSENEYKIDESNLDNLNILSYIAMSLSGMSYFSLKDFRLYIENNSITKLYFVSNLDTLSSLDKKYSTELDVTILDINKNNFSSLSSFDIDSKNEPLKIAINSLKDSISFKTTSTLYYASLNNDLSIEISENIIGKIETKVTQKDILVTSNYLNNVSAYGYHTYEYLNNSYLGKFNLEGESLIEKERYIFESISSYFDLFNISSDVFYLDSELDGYLKYKLNIDLEIEAISTLSLDIYNEYYSSFVYPFEVLVKDNSLYSIKYGVYNNDGYLFLVETIYSDLNNVTIDSSIFNNYIRLNYYGSYKEIDNCLVYLDDEEYCYTNIDTFFNLYLGSNYKVPFYTSLLTNDVDSYEIYIDRDNKIATLAIIGSDLTGKEEFINELKKLNYKEIKENIFSLDNIKIEFDIDSINSSFFLYVDISFFEYIDLKLT